MFALLGRLWREEDGFVITSEIILWGTIMGISTIVGVAAVRIAVVNVFMGQAEGIASKQTTDLMTLPNVVLYCNYEYGNLSGPGKLGTSSGGGTITSAGPGG